jgi:enamine deaminase RidA (YjgF/YER057c/UK114 family)
MTTPKVTKVKTGNPFEDKESFSRVIVVGDWIFTSNTAGRNPRTKVMSELAHEQASRAFDNIDAALKAVGSSLADVIRSRVTIPDPADVAAVMAVVGERFRGIDPVSTVTCAPLALDYLKFELEVTAYRGAGSSNADRTVISL